MKKFPLFLVIICVLGVFLACERDDDEPVGSSRVISRLYVSTSDYDGNSGTNYNNVFVIDPVDSVDFPEENTDSIKGTRSAAMGGAFIHFTPFGGIIFQGSQNYPSYIDTAVQVMSVSNTGVISTSYGRIPNRRFDGVRGLSFTIVSDSPTLSEEFLLMLNSSRLGDAKGTVDSLFVIARPRSQRNFSLPRYYIPLDYNPWGINISDRDVFVTSFPNDRHDKANHGIVVYKDLTTRFLANTADSLILNPTRFDLKISDAKNIRGISYSKAQDIMVVTDYETSGTDNKGRLLLFEKFSQYKEAGTITPTRIITSSSLQRPLDVAIDTRAEGKYIYVADAASKKVLRFSITDDGETTPNAAVGLFGRTPVSLSLDARSGVIF